MGLHGKLVAAIEFKAGGDVFHDFFRHTPHDVPTATQYVHACDLIEGEFGHAGSIITWTYTHGTFSPSTSSHSLLHTFSTVYIVIGFTQIVVAFTLLGLLRAH